MHKNMLKQPSNLILYLLRQYTDANVGKSLAVAVDDTLQNENENKNLNLNKNKFYEKNAYNPYNSTKNRMAQIGQRLVSPVLDKHNILSSINNSYMQYQNNNNRLDFISNYRNNYNKPYPSDYYNQR